MSNCRHIHLCQTEFILSSPCISIGVEFFHVCLIICVCSWIGLGVFAFVCVPRDPIFLRLLYAELGHFVSVYRWIPRMCANISAQNALDAQKTVVYVKMTIEFFFLIRGTIQIRLGQEKNTVCRRFANIFKIHWHDMWTGSSFAITSGSLNMHNKKWAVIL